MDLFKKPKSIVLGRESFAYVDEGRGAETILLIHGSSSDFRTWEKQIPALSSTYRTVAYSRRYARPNKDIDDGVDDQMLLHVEDLVALIKGLGLSSVHLVGHSWGGFIALLTALRYPELVQGLVIMEPPVLSLHVSTPPKPQELVRVLMKKPKLAMGILKFGLGTIVPAQNAYLKGDDDRASQILGRGILGRKFFSRISEKRLKQVFENRKADRAQLMGAGFPPLSEDEVRQLRSPTLVLHGEGSPLVFRQLAFSLENLIPHAKRVEVKSASHIMHEDQPNQVNKIILDFLSSISSDDPLN